MQARKEKIGYVNHAKQIIFHQEKNVINVSNKFLIILNGLMPKSSQKKAIRIIIIIVMTKIIFQEKNQLIGMIHKHKKNLKGFED